MKLLTHNMLSSRSMKGVQVGYPLGIEARDVKISEVDFNPDFIIRMMQRIDWGALSKAAENVGHGNKLPEMVVDDYEKNEDFLKKTHHVLMEIEVVNGDLICPETGRKFPISDGIPNMLLNEDEVS